MTLEQLRVFLEVARLEHVTEAARSLNMTQSAVSAAIAALERRHAVKLFDRVGRRIHLTVEGRSFVEEAAQVKRQAELAERFLADLAGTPSGPLRIMASQTVMSYWLPPYLEAFREKYPRVELQLRLGNTATTGAAVFAGSVDLGIVEGDEGTAGLLREVVSHDRLAIVVGERHAWAKGGPLAPEDLRNSSWVMREVGSGTRAAFEAHLRSRGIDPEKLDIVLELPSNEACLAAVTNGQSATVLSRRAAAPHAASGAACEANFPLPGRDFAVVSHPQRHRTSSLKALLALFPEGDDLMK